MFFGLDVGTTSVAGVAVSEAGVVQKSITLAHDATLSNTEVGVDAQDPYKLLDTARIVYDKLVASFGKPKGIGWTGQMHGVVGLDGSGKPVTPFITWRDKRRYGGVVMAEWATKHLNVVACECVCGWVRRNIEGAGGIDTTFLESWHIDEKLVPHQWIPPRVDGVMLGDNQAGVFAAQHIMPNCAVVNLGTSGQLSRVVDSSFMGSAKVGTELRQYPNGQLLLCRASLLGGRILADLRDELGISWDELNASAKTNARICQTTARIVDDLLVGMDITGVSGLVGVGNALVRNPCLKLALEDRLGLPVIIPQVDEMAAYGAALYRMRYFSYQ